MSPPQLRCKISLCTRQIITMESTEKQIKMPKTETKVASLNRSSFLNICFRISVVCCLLSLVMIQLSLTFGWKSNDAKLLLVSLSRHGCPYITQAQLYQEFGLFFIHWYSSLWQECNRLKPKILMKTSKSITRCSFEDTQFFLSFLCKDSLQGQSFER